MPNEDKVWILKIVDSNSQEVEITKRVHDYFHERAAKGLLNYHSPISTVNYLFTAHDVHSRKKAMVMQSYSNGALSDYLKRVGVRTPYERDSFIHYCFIALYNLLIRLQDELGLIHRDIKTQNILVNEKGECILADYGEAISVQQALDDLLDTRMRRNVVYPGTNTRPFEVRILHGEAKEQEQYALYLREHIHMIDLVDLVNTMLCAWNQLSVPADRIPLCYAPQTADDFNAEAKIRWYIQNERTVTKIGDQSQWLFNRDLPKTYKQLLIKFSVLAVHSSRITEPTSRRMAELLTWTHLRDSLANVMTHLKAQNSKTSQTSTHVMRDMNRKKRLSKSA
eukprot:310415_1